MIKKLSVIIPIYNGEQYLETCINSILNQKNIDLEIILIDDCSVDKSIHLMELYREDKRFKMIKKDLNSGQGPCRNEGLLMADGTYVLFIDVDDYLVSGDLYVLSRLVDRMDKELIDIVDCPYFLKKIGEENFIKNDLGNKVYENGIVYLNEIKTLEIVVWNKIFRRKFLVENRLRFESRKYEDVSFVLECYQKAGRVCNDSSVFYNYVIRENSTMTSKPSYSNVKDVIALMNDIEVLYHQNRGVFQIEKNFFYSFIGAARIIERSGLDNTQIKNEKNRLLECHRKYRKNFIFTRVLNVPLRIGLYASPFCANKLLRFFKK